jgi:serine/threonine protein phosphatase PrpC
MPDMHEATQHKWEAAAATNIGLVREGNEDAYGIRLDRGAFVVCDGMGGAAAGEIASRVATESFLSTIDGLEEFSQDGARAAVKRADQAVREAAQKDERRQGMGTTLVALLLADDARHGWLVHAGDSRAYRLRDGRLEQMTSDHSFVEEQVKSGQLTREEAERSPLRNVITRAVGSSAATEPDVLPIEVSPGDLFLLCTDGLTREVGADGLVHVLKTEHKLSAACSALVKEALASGGRDNITCLLVRAL